MSLSLVATVIGLIGLFMIIVVLFWQGFSGLSLAVFTQNTPPPGSAGGLMSLAVASHQPVTGSVPPAPSVASSSCTAAWSATSAAPVGNADTVATSWQDIC